jgi:hypothetical protein
MAVVINEFEVVPAETPPATPQRTQEPAASGKPRDPEREMERLIRKRRERAERLAAV